MSSYDFIYQLKPKYECEPGWWKLRWRPIRRERGTSGLARWAGDRLAWILLVGNWKGTTDGDAWSGRELILRDSLGGVERGSGGTSASWRKARSMTNKETT